MRKPHRFLYGLLTLFAMLTLGLLLSALVETPADVSPDAAGLPVVGAQFMPAVPITPEQAANGRVLAEGLRSLSPFAVISLMLPLLVIGIDANGRVLRKRRYVQSYYPVFKQELACG